MATYQPPKKNTAFIFYVSLVSQANTKLFQSSATIAAGDFKVSIDGGALNNLATLPAVTPAASKMIKIDLSAAEMNGDNIMVVASDAAGAEWCDAAWLLQTAARQVDDLAFPATSGRSLAVDVSGNVVLQAVTHTGAVIPTVTALTNDAGITQAGADKVWGSATRTLTAFSTALALSIWDVLESAILTASSIGLKLKGLTFTGAGKVDASLRDWLGTAPSALISGRVDANAQVVGTGAIVAGSFAAGARDAASQSADAVAEIADGVWDEAVSGHTTQGTYGERQNAVISGNAIAGTLSTTQMSTDLTEVTDSHYNGRTLIWTSGALTGQATNITAYAGATKVLTFTAVTEAPSAGDDFLIV